MAFQYFKENPFFSDPVLKKEYRHSPMAEVDGGIKDEYGITNAQAAFSWDLHVEPQVLRRMAINCHKLFTLLRFVGYKNQLEG